MKELQRRVGLSRAMIYLLMNTGKFPRQIPLSLRSVAWLENEVEDWIRERSEMRGTR